MNVGEEIKVLDDEVNPPIFFLSAGNDALLRRHRNFSSLRQLRWLRSLENDNGKAAGLDVGYGRGMPRLYINPDVVTREG